MIIFNVKCELFPPSHDIVDLKRLLYYICFSNYDSSVKDLCLLVSFLNEHWYQKDIKYQNDALMDCNTRCNTRCVFFCLFVFWQKWRPVLWMTEVMAYWIQLHWRIWLLVPLALDHLALAEDLKPTRWPLYPQKPLVLVWNAPTEDCRPRHNVHLQLDQFQIVASPNEGFTKQNLTMFYKDRLGLYPHFQDGVAVNGGLPQIASLTQHREKMPEGIAKYIRDPSARGLAVIDWEEWRPIWIRNWDTKAIYKSQSQLLVSQKKTGWTQTQIYKVAQQEFEMSSRIFMLETLRLAKSLRPNQLWGFYLFPDCYNHDYRRSLENYTGRCPDVEVARNDQLKWLWTESTALFPSIYMKSVLRSTSSARQFVRNRVKEGMRLASVGEGLARPVFVYSRPTYDDELELLTEVGL